MMSEKERGGFVMENNAEPKLYKVEPLSVTEFLLKFRNIVFT